MNDPDLSRLAINRAPAAVTVRRRRRGLVWLALLLAAGAALAWAWRGGHLTPPREVEVATITSAWPAQRYTLLNATGYVVAQAKAAVASKGTGRLEWLGVREGSLVKKDEVLARLESRDVAAARDQAAANVKVAEAGVAQAQAEETDARLALERARELVGRGFVSRASLDQAEARHARARAATASARSGVSAARAALASAQVALDYTLIRAPFDGVVLSKHANVGDVITPFNVSSDAKGAVVTMADMGTLEVEADVSESTIGQVRVDQPCEIVLDALPGRRFAGRVQGIVPTVDRSKATVMVKVRFEQGDPAILPEMSAKVAFLSQVPAAGDDKPLLVIPESALAERGGRRVALRLAAGRVEEVAVDTGGRLGAGVELRSGLAAGDRVVLKPPADLASGAAVKVKGQ